MNQHTLDDMVKMTLPQLERFVTAILVNKGKYSFIEVDEIINTAYVLLWEKGLEFNFVNMKKPILDAITQFEFNKNPKTTTLLMTQEEKCCNRCNEVKPVALFYKSNIYPNGLITYQDRCKKCADEICEKQKQKRLEVTEVREAYLARRREAARKKRELINSNPTLLEYYKQKWKEADLRFKQKKLSLNQ